MNEANKANDKQVGGNHYKNNCDYNHWDLATDTGMRHLEGTATKYLSRFGNKEGESAFKDLSKARHYVEKLVEVYEERRICSITVAQAQLNLTPERVEAAIAEFLATLTGPPADMRSKQAITLLATWYDLNALHAALRLIDSLTETYKE